MAERKLADDILAVMNNFIGIFEYLFTGFSRIVLRGRVSFTVFEERAYALVDLTSHHRSVILAVDRILSSSLLVLVSVVDACALLVEVWQNVGDVRRESPWLLEKIVG